MRYFTSSLPPLVGWPRVAKGCYSRYRMLVGERINFTSYDAHFPPFYEYVLSCNRMQRVNMCSGSLRSRVSCSLRSLCHVPYTMLWLAFAVAATSGRAHRAQHRRQAQARRSRDGRGYTNASSPASSDLSTLPAVGFCAATRVRNLANVSLDYCGLVEHRRPGAVCCAMSLVCRNKQSLCALDIDGGSKPCMHDGGG